MKGDENDAMITTRDNVVAIDEMKKAFAVEYHFIFVATSRFVSRERKAGTSRPKY
jgi:hypothetical protein